MRTVLIYLALLFFLLPLWLCSAVAGENSDNDRDKLIETLMERVTHLEAIIGEDKRPIVTKPSMAERLNRLEREFRESRSKARPQEYDLKHDLRQLDQSVQNISRRVDELKARVDRTEREADAMLKADDLSNLRRDFDRLQRQIDNLTQKVDRRN